MKVTEEVVALGRFDNPSSSQEPGEGVDKEVEIYELFGPLYGVQQHGDGCTNCDTGSDAHAMATSFWSAQLIMAFAKLYYANVQPLFVSSLSWSD